MQILLFTSIHQTFNSAALPMLVSTMANFKSQLELGSMQLFSPILIFMVFLAYPLIVFFFLKNKLFKLSEESE
jgi:hypothetical protein